MSLKLTRQMPSFEGVAAGQTATLRLPIGFSYNQLLVTYTGVTLAQMTQLRVVANGQVIHRYQSGTVLDSMNQYESRTAAGGLLIIDFERFNMRTRAGEEFTVLGTGMAKDPTPVTTLSLEIDIDAGAAAPALSARAVQSVPRALGLIKKIRTFSYSPTGAGDYDISDLPKGDLINQIFFGPSAGNITRLQVFRDNFTVFDRTSTENTRMQNDGVRTPASFTGYVYDPTENGNGSEQLITANVNDLRFTLSVSAAMTITTGVVYLGGLNA